MSDENKGFVIKDRRGFAEDSATEAKKTPHETAKPEDQGTQAADGDQPQAAAGQTRTDEQAHLPEMNFATFIISMNASALVHLGIIEEPGSGEKNKNLPMAKQTIDLLSMLEEKTQGNLTKDEESMLKNILYDLRIMYVREQG